MLEMGVREGSKQQALGIRVHLRVVVVVVERHRRHGRSRIPVVGVHREALAQLQESVRLRFRAWYPALPRGPVKAGEQPSRVDCG